MRSHLRTSRARALMGARGKRSQIFQIARAISLAHFTNPHTDQISSLLILLINLPVMHDRAVHLNHTLWIYIEHDSEHTILFGDEACADTKRGHDDRQPGLADVARTADQLAWAHQCTRL